MFRRLRESTFKKFIPVKEASAHIIKYPPDHQLGMRVPKGGSSCLRCEFLGTDKKTCVNKLFIAWEGPNKPAGSNKLPLAADEYCCDLYKIKGAKK